MKTVIMAGGKGTRLADILSDAGGIPKPMVKIEGKPILEREIECLKKQGFTDIILTVGYLGQAIREYFGDGGAFGVHISYFQETEPLGNAGALFRMKDSLAEDFLLLNADVLFDVDFNRFVRFHKEHGALATLFTHPNSHPYDSGLIISDEQGAVARWLAKEDERPLYYKNRVNAGLHVLSPKLLNQEISTPKIDLDRQLLKPLAGTGRMFCYDSPEYVKDMGTPERYQAVCRDFKDGLVTAKNLHNRQKAVFLDRDGTINRHVGFLTDIDAFELLSGVAKAVNQFHALGYLVIVVTNQPVVARGEVTFRELEEIHSKMETLLGLEGAYIDGLYFCPHHPHGGFEGEVAELKIDCGCRKPKPGMLLQAASDFHIDLSASWMAGDSRADIEAGRAAGCRTVLVGGTGQDYGQDFAFASLEEFSATIGRLCKIG